MLIAFTSEPGCQARPMPLRTANDKIVLSSSPHGVQELDNARLSLRFEHTNRLAKSCNFSPYNLQASIIPPAPCTHSGPSL